MAREIRLIGRLICEDAAEAELVRRLLPEHIRLTRAEPGCLQFDVEELPGTTIWEVRERFEDKGAFELHQSRTKASAWGEQTAHIRRDFELDEVDPDEAVDDDRWDTKQTDRPGDDSEDEVSPS